MCVEDNQFPTIAKINGISYKSYECLTDAVLDSVKRCSHLCLTLARWTPFTAPDDCCEIFDGANANGSLLVRDARRLLLRSKSTGRHSSIRIRPPNRASFWSIQAVSDGEDCDHILDISASSGTLILELDFGELSRACDPAVLHVLIDD
eukprot:SAG31_NODE_16500_length_707_cov_0.623355_1_plen_148_part_10